MKNKKQSSIEWLFFELLYTPKDKFEWHSMLRQAKEMHKEEMISSYKNAMASAYLNTHNWMPQEGYIHKSEQYYKETFGGQENE